MKNRKKRALKELQRVMNEAPEMEGYLLRRTDRRTPKQRRKAQAKIKKELGDDLQSPEAMLELSLEMRDLVLTDPELADDIPLAQFLVEGFTAIRELER